MVFWGMVYYCLTALMVNTIIFWFVDGIPGARAHHGWHQRQAGR